MRFLVFLIIATIVGGTIGLVVGGLFTAKQPTADELVQMELQYNIAQAQETADKLAQGIQPTEPTPFAPPKPSWPVAHPRLVGFLVADAATLIVWLALLLVFSFTAKPATPPAPDSLRSPDGHTPPPLRLLR